MIPTELAAAKMAAIADAEAAAAAALAAAEADAEAAFADALAALPEQRQYTTAERTRWRTTAQSGHYTHAERITIAQQAAHRQRRIVAGASAPPPPPSVRQPPKPKPRVKVAPILRDFACRGIALALRDGKVIAFPSLLLTDLDRATLRETRDAVAAALAVFETF